MSAAMSPNSNLAFLVLVFVEFVVLFTILAFVHRLSPKSFRLAMGLVFVLLAVLVSLAAGIVSL